MPSATTPQPESTAFAEVLAELRAIRAALESQTPRESVTDLLTVAEVAKKIRMSEDSVVRLIRAGTLRASKVGAGTKRARWIIESREVTRFLAAGSNTPAPAKKRQGRPAQRKSETPNYF
jgi:excisionase family DNA binding protein